MTNLVNLAKKTAKNLDFTLSEAEIYEFATKLEVEIVAAQRKYRIVMTDQNLLLRPVWDLPKPPSSEPTPIYDQLLAETTQKPAEKMCIHGYTEPHVGRRGDVFTICRGLAVPNNES